MCSQPHGMQLRDEDGGTGWALVNTRHTYVHPQPPTVNMSMLSPSLLLSSGRDLVGEALDVHLHFLQAQVLPFLNTEKRPHVPAHGAVLLATGNHLKRKGSALPPARHALRPVSIALRRREVVLSLFCSCSPRFVLWSWHWDAQRVKELLRAGETQFRAESSQHKAFAGFQVAGVRQHHQQQQLRGMARCLHGCSSCRTIPALSANSLT